MSVEVRKVAEELFEQLKETKNLTPEWLASMHFIFDQKLLVALDIIDRGLCTCFVAKPSGRSVYQVVGGSSKAPEIYVCWSHYCSCMDFMNSVLRKRDAFVNISLLLLLVTLWVKSNIESHRIQNLRVC
eukprot:TRINITY_DN4761_c0_g1_i2.p1 TRINITY_DN4761_c0_g1~~TRINITY_DN4761_c0_g1_i2.p1  ORF type:complete len:129 (+),score=10.25 TRINITY_DN4761_c0_g1_i2:29-415(+)